MRTPPRAAHRRGPTFWIASPEWEGHAAFIICGGTSVLQQDLSLLKGRKVGVINSSVYTYPDADFLYFGDMKWWREHRARLIKSFKGRIVSVDESVSRDDPVLRMKRAKPPGLSSAPDALVQKATSLTAIINLFVHLQANPIVLLGADGREIVEDGKPLTHHHTPHRWEARPDRFKRWHNDLATIVDPLRLRGVSVLNVSPGTAWEWWPVFDRIEDVLPLIERRQAA